MTKFIVFESNCKHSDYEVWFTILMEKTLTPANKKKMYQFIKNEFEEAELTYVDTANPYIYNQTKFKTLLDFLEKEYSVRNFIFCDVNGNDTNDPNVKKEDKNSYLYPVNYRVSIIDLKESYKI